jgi:hypothetical protein
MFSSAFSASLSSRTQAFAPTARVRNFPTIPVSTPPCPQHTIVSDYGSEFPHSNQRARDLPRPVHGRRRPLQ